MKIGLLSVAGSLKNWCLYVSAKKTVSIGVPTELVRGDVFQWGPLMAGALLASIPVAVVYTFFLDRFIAGFTMGAVK